MHTTSPYIDPPPFNSLVENRAARYETRSTKPAIHQHETTDTNVFTAFVAPIDGIENEIGTDTRKGL